MFLLNGHIQKLKSIMKQFALHVRVKGRVTIERWRVVHLKQPRITITINKYIKSKNLKAHVVIDIARLRRAIVVHQVGLD